MPVLKVLTVDCGSPPSIHAEVAAALVPSGRVGFELERSRHPDRELAPNLDALAAAAGASVVILLLGRDPPPTSWFRALSRQAARVPTISIVAASTPSMLFELEEFGIGDVLPTPVTAASLLPRLWRLVEAPKANPEVSRISDRLKEKLGLRQLVGESPSFLAEVRKLPLVARSTVGVLIQGESGTGKELIARAIHYLGKQPRGAFVAVNCGAIPADLLENELFGHVRSAYTGAHSEQQGLLDEAAGGTLFLDEIDAMPPASQVKLLRFLQEKEYRRLGSTRVRRCNARVIAATNADVETAVAQQRLRTDLYYRLNVIPLEIPPLRRRREDIPLLARHFLDVFSHELDRKPPEIGRAAAAALLAHRWPGNVRELEHTIHRALVLSDGATRIERRHLQIPGDSPAAAHVSFKEAKARAVARFERAFLTEALAAAGGNISRAARRVDKNRRAFWELMRKHEIDATSFRPSSKMRAPDFLAHR